MPTGSNLTEIQVGTGRLFVVGDIHGCLEELSLMIEFLKGHEGLSSQDKIIFIGDYIDRGPQSKEVVEYLISFKESHDQTWFLGGNHEEMLLSYVGLRQGESGLYYLQNGGADTLISYGLSEDSPASDLLAAIPESHLRFYQSLERLIVTEQFVFVHAGLSPLKPLEDQVDQDIYWIRDEFIMNLHRFGKLVVFGHTPFEDVMIHTPYKIGIDTGLVYGNKLSCIELSKNHLFQIQRGKKELRAKDLLPTKSA